VHVSAVSPSVCPAKLLPSLVTFNIACRPSFFKTIAIFLAFPCLIALFGFLGYSVDVSGDGKAVVANELSRVPHRQEHAEREYCGK
jgi:hypothetical protein